MATNAEFPPYEFFIDGVIYGIDGDIMNAACDELNMELFIDNMGFDGIQVSKDIHDAITAGGLDSGLLAASFKNSQQVLELTRYGVKAVTVAPDVIDSLVKNAAIDAAIEQFTKDFEGLVGEGKTMADC